MTTTHDLERLTSPSLILEVLERVEAARAAIVVLAERVNPALADLVLDNRETEPSGSAGGLRPVPAGARGVYERFRRDVLALNPGVTVRQSLRDGRVRYEGFHFAGDDRIYANFRRHVVHLNFEFPPGDGVSNHDVITGAGRQWRVMPLKSEKGLPVALDAARMTIRHAEDHGGPNGQDAMGQA